MTHVAQPSRNRMLDTAWKNYKAAQKADAKSAKSKPAEAVPVPVKKAKGKKK